MTLLTTWIQEGKERLSVSTPYLHMLSTGTVPRLHHALFATEVPSIPDLSSYQQFEQVDEIEQFRRVINSLRLLLLGLNVQPNLEHVGGRAFELRYIWDGRQLRMAILGKGTATDEGKARDLALSLWNDLLKLYPSDFYRGGLRSAQDWETFSALYAPFPLDRAQVVALEKQVEFHRLRRSGQEYTVPYPYKWGISSMAGLCKTLLRQESPHIVSIGLVPWQLTSDELVALNTLAGVLRKAGEGRERSRRMGIASTQAAGHRQVTSRDQSGASGRETFMPDHQARLAAAVYEGYLERYERPMLLRLYVASDTDVDPSVIGALQAEMVGHIPSSEDPKQETALPHLPREIWLENESLARARENLEYLEAVPVTDEINPMLQVEGELSSSCATLARLPYLVDVQEASCAFRLPAVTHPDEIGVATHSGAFIARTPGNVLAPTITLGRQGDDVPYLVHLHDLTKHVLVAGTTGSGKTTTCLHLLSELARFDIPFMVIEPTNAEHNDYRSLLRLDSLQHRLQIFTLGDEETLPFRLNPFEVQSGITITEHISSLLTAFKAAIPMWEPLPRLFLKALNRTYYRSGWTAFQKPIAGHGFRPFPTLWDFYTQLSQVVEHEIEHAGEVRSNIIGASKLRVEALMEGSCGRILSARRSIPIESWLERPTVVELRHIGDDEDKALMIAFVLMMVNEYLEKGRSRLSGRNQLRHVMLIEEAHRLLADVGDETSPDRANTKGQAAQAFAHALAETRKYGEGIIIAEQLPTKLVPDVIGNTGLKIMHRLTSTDDREIMGRAMRFDQFQEEFVAGLHTGQAAIYGLDAEEPTLLQASNFWEHLQQSSTSVNTMVSDDELADMMTQFRQQYADFYLPYAGCRLCPAPCIARDHGEALLFDKSLGLLRQFTDLIASLQPEQGSEGMMIDLVDFCTSAVAQFGSERLSERDSHASVYCLYIHLENACDFIAADAQGTWELNFRVVQENTR